MRDVDVVENEVVEERIHAGRCVTLRREILRLPAEQGHPALGLERTTLPDGPERPPVILVHGFAQNRYTWRVSERSLAGRLAEEGFEVLNLELRGHGRSREYGAGCARTFDEYVDDVTRVALRCDVAPFAVGHSLGGGVIVGASTKVPLAGLVHIAGVFRFGGRNPTLQALARASLKLERYLKLAPPRVSTGFAGRIVGRLYAVSDIAGYGFPISGWTPGSVEKEILRERLARGFDWTSVEVWLQMSRWAMGEPFAYAEAFGRRDTPLLVIAGDHDALLPPEDAVCCYEASGSEDRTFTVFDRFEHGSHWGHLDLLLGRRAPAVVWPRIVEWLVDRS